MGVFTGIKTLCAPCRDLLAKNLPFNCEESSNNTRDGWVCQSCSDKSHGYSTSKCEFPTSKSSVTPQQRTAWAHFQATQSSKTRKSAGGHLSPLDTSSVTDAPVERQSSPPQLQSPGLFVSQDTPDADFIADSQPVSNVEQEGEVEAEVEAELQNAHSNFELGANIDTNTNTWPNKSSSDKEVQVNDSVPHSRRPSSPSSLVFATTLSTASTAVAHDETRTSSRAQTPKPTLPNSQSQPSWPRVIVPLASPKSVARNPADAVLEEEELAAVASSRSLPPPSPRIIVRHASSADDDDDEEEEGEEEALPPAAGTQVDPEIEIEVPNSIPDAEGMDIDDLDGPELAHARLGSPPPHVPQSQPKPQPKVPPPPQSHLHPQLQPRPSPKPPRPTKQLTRSRSSTRAWPPTTVTLPFIPNTTTTPLQLLCHSSPDTGLPTEPETLNFTSRAYALAAELRVMARGLFDELEEKEMEGMKSGGYGGMGGERMGKDRMGKGKRKRGEMEEREDEVETRAPQKTRNRLFLEGVVGRVGTAEA